QHVCWYAAVVSHHVPFFFSSRRRHTRSKRDWSSDVCSSDLFLFLFIWVRGTLPRMRYDQFMKLGWKVLIPTALGWIIAVALVQGVRQFSDVDLQTLLGVIGGVLLLFVIASFFWPQKRQEEQEEPAETFDAFAQGYPVPPLPGQELPPSPRKRAMSEATASASALPADVQTPDEEVDRD